MNNTLIDELEIIKELGKGGFGIVYLAKAKDGSLYALKKIFKDKAEHAKKERNALEVYKKFSNSNKTANLLKIIDIKDTDDGISYLMPLADGLNSGNPLDDNWQALTLEALVKDKYSKEEVFTKEEVLNIFLPLFKTITKLNNEGIVHRDIKPENIIFVKGKPYLADIGLMTEDDYNLSTPGTRDYQPTTSAYIDAGGNVDMWGLAATLYFFLGGNSIKSGKWYPVHKDKMQKTDIKAWGHFNRVILRATRTNPLERYISFEDFTDSFKNINKKEIDFSKLDNPNFHSSIFSLKGRLGKKPFAICYSIASAFLLLMKIVIDKGNIGGYIAYIPYLTIFWILMSLIIKRTHDAGLNGFWGVLIYFSPRILIDDIIIAIDLNIKLTYISIFVYVTSMLIALILKSENKINKYGVPNQRLTFFN